MDKMQRGLRRRATRRSDAVQDFLFSSPGSNADAAVIVAAAAACVAAAAGLYIGLAKNVAVPAVQVTTRAIDRRTDSTAAGRRRGADGVHATPPVAVDCLENRVNDIGDEKQVEKLRHLYDACVLESDAQNQAKIAAFMPFAAIILHSEELLGSDPNNVDSVKRNIKEYMRSSFFEPEEDGFNSY